MCKKCVGKVPPYPRVAKAARTTFERVACGIMAILTLAISLMLLAEFGHIPSYNPPWMQPLLGVTFLLMGIGFGTILAKE